MAKKNKAQNKVEASELLFRSMTENSADIIIRQDAKGKIIYITPSVFDTAGYMPEELLGLRIFDLLHGDDIALVKAAYTSVLEKQAKPARHEFRMKHKDGKILWMEGTVVNMLNVPGVTSVIVNMRDVTFRKEAERKMFASEVKFRSLIENTHDGITLMSAEGKLLYLSSACTRIVGYTPEELVGTDPRDLSHPDDLEPVAIILGGLYPRFGEMATAEYRLKHKNGEWRWLKSTITNLLHEEHVGAFVFNYEDITEQKRTEALIRQSERMMADAEKMAHFGSWELDIHGNAFGELRWSEEVFRIFGHEPGSVAVSTEVFFEAVHPEDVARVAEATAQAQAENKRYSIDHRVILPDGAVRWVHEDAEFVTVDEAAGLYKFLGTVQDITDKKEAEDKLLKSKANLKAIFYNTEIGYIMLDENMRVVTFNPQAERLVQMVYMKAIQPGDLFTGQVKGFYEAGRLTALLKKVIDGENMIFDHKAVLPEGGEVWYGIRINPIVGNDRNVHGICISIADITLRKQQELEREKITTDLMQRNKDLEQFTYVISHNLRAPLTNIMGLSQLLQDDGQDAEFRKIYNKQLSVSVEKMDIIIKDLNYILQTKKELSEVKEAVTFTELVNDIKLSIENIMRQEHVEVITDFTQTDVFLTVKSYLYSIFYNLITNSIKYRRPGVPPVIEITSRLDAKKLQLVFSDNGLGIDLKRRSNEVFGLFKRFHHHTEGKGMGLFMTKTQVQTLGGSISVESEIDSGTRFLISFPLD